ncbi:MAG: M48 family metallopeptidase [Salibacteraceae bacterium]
MTKYFFTLIFLVLTISLFSQSNEYTGLKSRGTIPEDFTKLTLEKIKDAQLQAQQEKTRSKKEQEKFYEMSNFGVDQLLQSGMVCFNDTISNYVENVLEEIRFANKSVPLDIRVYTIKSPVVNAFTTDQGIIFINTGLLAQLENEAQLAFILCHEIIHYTENHVMEGFIENSDIANRRNDYKRVRSIDRELATSRFSRKLESEADKKGLELFLNTGYNPAEVDGVFDVLLYSYLPFDEIPFDSSILEVSNYQIPDKFFLTSLNPIKVNEDEDDSRHTHPNIGTRRRKAESIVSEAGKSGKNFLVSSDDFYAVRSAARYEVLRLQLINCNYSEALYSAYILEKDFPNNPLPKIAIGEILFGAAIFTNTKDRKKVTGYYKKKQGYSQQVYYLLNKLKPADLTLLALRYNYYLHTLYPENDMVDERITILCRDLDYYHDISFNHLNFTKQSSDSETSIAENKTSGVKPVTKKSKYDKIKQGEKNFKSKTNYDVDWAYGVFTGCKDEDEIEEYFEKGQKLAERERYRLAETDDPELNAQSEKEKAQYNKVKLKKGRSLGINKIVMVDPYYSIYNFSKKESHRQIKSEKEEIEMLGQFEEMAEFANLDLDILTNYKFESSDVTKYNDFSLINEWVSERFTMENRSGSPSSSEEVQELINRYGTKYFAWTGVVNTTVPREGKFYVALLSVYSVIGIPFGIYYIVTPQKSTQLYFALFNIETGQLIMYENRDLPMNDSDGLLNSHFYDIFNQIRN